MSRDISRRPSPAMAVACVALVVALGGAAEAAIPDSSGAIHGCYVTNTGQLSVIDSSNSSCGAGQTALDWSQRGPTGASGPAGATGATGTGATGPKGPGGPRGAAGAKGAAGQRGAIGPSDAFSTGETPARGVGTTAKLVQRLALPAGEYVVSAQVNVASPLISISRPKRPIYQSFTCSLTTPGAAQAFGRAQASVVAGIGEGRATLPLQGIVELPARATVQLDCADSQKSPGNYTSSAAIDAIRVAALHG